MFYISKDVEPYVLITQFFSDSVKITVETKDCEEATNRSCVFTTSAILEFVRLNTDRCLKVMS